MKYEKVETFMNITDGQYQQIENLMRFLHKLKVINIVSFNPGRWASDVPTKNQVENYIRIVMRVKKM